MTGILILEGVELGYCDQCGGPGVVGIFRVFNWHHKFRVCEGCLGHLSQEVEYKGEGLLREGK